MSKQEAMDVSREQKSLLLFQPHMTALAFSLNHYKSDPAGPSPTTRDKNMIACTDGNSVWYGEKYQNLEQSGRNYIFMHELMHGIFKHGARIGLIHLQKGIVFPVLANYAADAIINTAIDEDPAFDGIALFKMPKEFPGITMKTIHEIMKEAIAFSKKTPPLNYDKDAKTGLQMESVYNWLVWAKCAVEEKRKEDASDDQGNGPPEKQKGSPGGQGMPGAGGKVPSDEDGGEPGEEESDGDGQGADVPSDETQIERITRTEKAWDIEEAVDTIRKLLESGVTASELIERANNEIDEARAKIQSIIQGLKMAGTGQGGMLLSLENDLPLAVVPWNKKLRKLITRDLGTKMDDSYTRYGSATRAGIVMKVPTPFQPGTTIFTERPRVLVVLDVSGSHISSLNQCFAEIWSIVRMKNAAVDLITFDWGVQEKIEIRNKHDFRKVINKGIYGGGGTGLQDVFIEAKKMRTPYRAMVIMTDGYLSPPADTFGINIVWMVTPGGTTEGLHNSGEVINLPDYTQ